MKVYFLVISWKVTLEMWKKRIWVNLCVSDNFQFSEDDFKGHSKQNKCSQKCDLLDQIFSDEKSSIKLEKNMFWRMGSDKSKSSKT